MADDMSAASGTAAIDNLYPALTQCFAIITCGYLAGRMNLISETEAKGINTFVGTFSLPSLIFMSLAQLELSSVNWTFLLSILLAKSLVFFAVILVTLLSGVGRSCNFGRAGIFAIFCTQSNDFAIGYPIVAALYKTSHPDYASYLYLMAPISLAILNPVSFVLMEIGKRRTLSSNLLSPTGDQETMINDGDIPQNSPNIHKERFKMVASVARNIAFNPIILMTVLGVLGNVVFKHQVPSYLAGVLDVLGSAFSASALFLLGLRMVGKVHKLRGATLVVPGILIMVKLLALPIVIREVISMLHAGSNTTETVDLSTYGFLYGTFPSAPTVFVFATQYSIDVDLIASAMVACTFISAPLMFVSAKMITITNADPADYIKQLDSFTLDVSIIAILACLWVIFVFTLTKKITRLPHKITACLIGSQLISCLGAILWNTLHQKQGWPGYIQFSLFTVGVYSSRLWTMILSVTLLFLQCRSLCYVLKLQPFFIVIGWGLPVILTTILLIFDKKDSTPFDKRNPNFVYGASQAIIAVSLLVLCFIVTVGCLILHQRYRRRFSRYLDLANDVSSDPRLTENDDDVPSPTSSTEAETSTDVILNGESSSSTNPGTSSGGSDSGISPGTIGGKQQLTMMTNHKCGSESCCDDTVISPVVDIEDLLSKGTLTTTTQAQQQQHPASDVMRTFVQGEPSDGDITDENNSRDQTMCASRFGCRGGPKRGERCQGIARQYQQPIDDDLEYIEEEPESHDPQILRHTVLLILLLCSMFVGLAISIWTLVMEQMSGIYIELSFLDVTLNFGQSIIAFAIFGLDTKEVALPLLKLWRKLWYGANTLVLPSWHELSAETRHICDQFVTHHLHNCRGSIATDKRWRLKVYRNVFTGHQFVDWLIDVGLARDRVEAVHYARHLIEGKVLKHINGVYHFYDRNLLYTFV